MEINKSELIAIEEKVDEVEIQQLGELELACVGGGTGIVCF